MEKKQERSNSNFQTNEQNDPTTHYRFMRDALFPQDINLGSNSVKPN